MQVVPRDGGNLLGPRGPSNAWEDSGTSGTVGLCVGHMEQPRGDTVTHAHALESLGFSLPRRVEIGLVVTTDTVVANLELFGIVGVHTGRAVNGFARCGVRCGFSPEPLPPDGSVPKPL